MRLHLAAVMVCVGCASTASVTPGARLFDPKERKALQTGAEATQGERFRILRLPPSVGRLRWDPDQSEVGATCPGDLLQKIRDETGRLNQKVTEGTTISLTVHVDHCAPETLLSPPVVSYAFVLRNGQSGRSLVVGAGEVGVASALFESPADDRAAVVGREVRRRVERSLDSLRLAVGSKRAD